jgi:hypothetical protein
MNVQESFKKAAATKDWQLIDEIYHQFFGEHLTLEQIKDNLEKKPKRKSKKTIYPWQNIEIESPKIIDDQLKSKNGTSAFMSPIFQPNPSKNKQDIKNKQCRSEPLGTNSYNLFYDDATIAPEELKKQNPQLNKLYGQKHQRNRSPAESQLINVVCYVCGKQECVSPILATSYSKNPDENSYRCNKCCSK